MRDILLAAIKGITDADALRDVILRAVDKVESISQRAETLNTALNNLINENNKLLCEKTELQAAVHRLQGPRDTNIDMRGLTEKEAQAVHEGNFINAIKMVRARTGEGLKEAKDLVDCFRPLLCPPKKKD